MILDYRMVYFAFFYSVKQYGVEIWGSTRDFNNIFKTQKKIIRIMTFSTSCKPLFKNLKLLTLPSLYIYKSILFAKTNLRASENQSHHYHTRNKNAIIYEKHHLSLFQKHPSYMGGKLFNNLPFQIKSTE